MNDHFCIIRIEDKYFMQLHDTGSTKDGLIAKEIGLSIKEYRTILRENFNGIDENSYIINRIPDTCFTSLEDVRKAVNWANSMLMMHKLRKKSKKV